MSIADKLMALRTSVKGIRHELEEHGVELEDVPLSEYPDIIRDLKVGGGFEIGHISLSKMNTADPEWLPCNGGTIALDAYPTLTAVLGEARDVEYDFTQGPVSGTPSLPNNGVGVAWSPDGAYIAVGHWGTPYCTIIDTATWTIVPGTPSLPGAGRSVAWSPDGAYLAVAHVTAPYCTIIDTATWTKVPGTPSLPGNGEGVTWSPDGAYIAVGHSGAPYCTIIDTATWTKVPGTPSLSNIGRAVAWSPDGSYLAVGHSGAPYCTIIDTATWTKVPGTSSLPDTGWGVTWSPDGAYLAVGHWGAPYCTILPVRTVTPLGYVKLPDEPPITYGDVTVQPMIKAGPPAEP